MDIYDFIENHYREMKEFAEKYEDKQESADFDPAEEFRIMISRWCEGNDMVAKMFILAAAGYDDYVEGDTSQKIRRLFHLIEDEKILKKLEYVEGFRDYHVVEFDKQDLE